MPRQTLGVGSVATRGHCEGRFGGDEEEEEAEEEEEDDDDDDDDDDDFSDAVALV